MFTGPTSCQGEPPNGSNESVVSHPDRTRKLRFHKRDTQAKQAPTPSA